MDKQKNKLVVYYEPNLTNENIEYVFQRLIFSITAATFFENYKYSKEQFNKILDIIRNWLAIYINTKSISKIDFNEFISIRQQLFELDSKYISCDGFYAAECYEWILQLQILLEKSKERNDVNSL